MKFRFGVWDVSDSVHLRTAGNWLNDARKYDPPAARVLWVRWVHRVCCLRHTFSFLCWLCHQQSQALAGQCWGTLRIRFVRSRRRTLLEACHMLIHILFPCETPFHLLALMGSDSSNKIRVPLPETSNRKNTKHRNGLLGWNVRRSVPTDHHSRQWSSSCQSGGSISLARSH